MDNLTHYLNWVLYEVKPAAEEYADDFFKHMTATLDEKSTALMNQLETEEGRGWTHDMTVPVINATILENMADHCTKAARGWRELYQRGISEHFPNG